jgi:hypothetical protein
MDTPQKQKSRNGSSDPVERCRVMRVKRGQRPVSQLPHNEQKNDEDAPIDSDRDAGDLTESNVLAHLPSTSTMPSDETVSGDNSPPPFAATP